MTVEDLLEALGTYHKIESHPFAMMMAATVMDNQTWDTRFIINTLKHIRRDRALSTEQAKIVLKMAQRLEPQLREGGHVSLGQVETITRCPTYRQPPYPSANIPREVRYLGRNLLGFRFKYNDVIREDLRKLDRKSDNLPKPPIWFHREHRIWVVPVTRTTLAGIETIISEHRFDFDEVVVAYLTKCHNSRGEQSAFAYDPELGVIAANVCDNELLAWWITAMTPGEEV